MRCECGKVTPRFGRVRSRIKELHFLECCRKTRTSRPSENTRRPADVCFQHTDGVQSGRLPSEAQRPDGNPTRTAADCSEASASENRPQPRLLVNVGIHTEAYSRLRVRTPIKRSAKITAIADSGAQMRLMGQCLLGKLGLSRKQLLPADKRIVTVNNGEINNLGAAHLKISGCSAVGHRMETMSTMYVTDSTGRLYLIHISFVFVKGDSTHT